MFDSETTNLRIKYQFPFKGIYNDLDGSLTGRGANSWAVAHWPHLEQPECHIDYGVYDGIICGNTVQVRRIAWFGWEFLWSRFEEPDFRGAAMKITQWDDSVVKGLKTNKTMEAMLNMELDGRPWSVVPFKEESNPSDGWAIPFVTKHAYRFNWGDGIQISRMLMQPSD